jgi:hypothetical protein
MVPYPGFRYTLPVPTVRWVHLLDLKPLVCIPFLQELCRMSVLKRGLLYGTNFISPNSIFDY